MIRRARASPAYRRGSTISAGPSTITAAAGTTIRGASPARTLADSRAHSRRRPWALRTSTSPRTTLTSVPAPRHRDVQLRPQHLDLRVRRRHHERRALAWRLTTSRTDPRWTRSAGVRPGRSSRSVSSDTKATPRSPSDSSWKSPLPVRSRVSPPAPAPGISRWPAARARRQQHQRRRRRHRPHPQRRARVHDRRRCRPRAAASSRSPIADRAAARQRQPLQAQALVQGLVVTWLLGSHGGSSPRRRGWILPRAASLARPPARGAGAT